MPLLARPAQIPTLPLDSRAECSLDEAYALCVCLARTHYENFTVGSWLLPRDKLRHVCAIYAFCRTVDDLGDEAQGDRLALLDEWEADLRRCYTDTPRHPYLKALQATIRTFDIPLTPFLKLIEANRLDQRHTRWPTYQDLLFYCDHSANPVGHLFLYLFGYRDAERQRLADATCTALQLTNFWQDVRRDWDKGRIYIPLEDMARFGYTEGDLAQGVVNDAFRRLMAFEVERTRALFQQGLALVEKVEGLVRLDIKLFSLGGLAVLDAIERQGYDTLTRRPVVSKPRKVWLLLKTLVGMKVRGQV
ncbi:MAG: squalene synthase HpnC [Dehalococcoidia bacterium]|nr:squalene synthase HpnC [Dehalococcoidia bacterium]MDW8120466.1 squalene synthase HpnC [Chloroflexota bacterium]